MAELKTKKNKASVEDFINQVDDDQKRKDSFVILDMMKRLLKEKPVMFGNSIVGFGSYHYKSSSGREGEWFVAGFSPRKQNLTIYLATGFAKTGALLKKLGKHKTGRSCLYINKLEDVDMKVLEKLIADSSKNPEYAV